MTSTFDHKRHISISNDFEMMDYDNTTFDRYEFTWQIPERNYFIDYLVEHRGQSKEILEDSQTLFEDFYHCLPDYWWDDDMECYSLDERSEIPMMNTLWYYPQFISFTDADRLKTVGCITLLFDKELDRWAIAMCGGGMDLTPQLVASFINLGKCVPVYLAQSMSVNYPGYVNQGLHLENCYQIANALKQYGKSISDRGQYLEQKVWSATDPIRD